MPIKYKLSGLDEVGKDVAQNMRNTFRTKLEKLVREYLEYQISAQIDAENKPMPKKKPATIKQYQKEGYNTDKFLVRTGKSTELNVTISGDTMVIQPKGYEILKNLIPSRVEWMTINDQLVNEITNKFLEELKKEFK